MAVDQTMVDSSRRTIAGISVPNSRSSLRPMFQLDPWSVVCTWA